MALTKIQNELLASPVNTGQIAKAWGVFNSSGTLLANYNVTSVSKSSAGQFTATLTNALPSTNAAVVVSTAPALGYRYWRYIVGTTVEGHYPNVSRILLVSADGTQTNVVTYTGDNCSDSGSIPTNGTTYSYDFGTATTIVAAGAYSVYSGGSRSCNATVQYSSDNTNWTTAFTYVQYNRVGNVPTGAITCGIITSSPSSGITIGSATVSSTTSVSIKTQVYSGSFVDSPTTSFVIFGV